MSDIFDELPFTETPADGLFRFRAKLPEVKWREPMDWEKAIFKATSLNTGGALDPAALAEYERENAALERLVRPPCRAVANNTPEGYFEASVPGCRNDPCCGEPNACNPDRYLRTLSDIPEIPVTPEMIVAADHASRTWSRDTAGIPRDPVSCYVSVYRAMAAVAPNRLRGSEATVRALVVRQNDEMIALTGERDSARRSNADLLACVAELEDTLRVVRLDRDASRAVEMILRDELARRPAAFVDPEAEPAKHDPFRDFGHDPRRMGR